MSGTISLGLAAPWAGPFKKEARHPMKMMIHRDDFDVGNDLDDHDFIRCRYNDDSQLFIRFGSSMNRRLLKKKP